MGRGGEVRWSSGQRAVGTELSVAVDAHLVRVGVRVRARVKVRVRVRIRVRVRVRVRG